MSNVDVDAHAAVAAAPSPAAADSTTTSARRGRRRRAPSPLSFVSIFVLIVAWVVATRLELVDELKMPYPEGVWDTATQIKLRIFGDLGLTVYRVYFGFLVGGALGIGVGLLMSLSRTVRLLLDPIIEILRPIPPLAFIPFIILWMGIGDGGKLVLIALGSFLTLVVTTVEATRTVSPVYVQAARTLCAGSRHL
jgi:ABC-type nitrate/sulfonate/bicarbonate transport system permease component